MSFLPLGTVVKVNEIKVCIIGYTAIEKDETHVSGYFVVPYPIGFVSIDKVFFIPQNVNYEILAEGYKTEASERVLETLNKSLEMARQVPVEELVKFNETYKALSAKKGAEER